MTKHEPFIMLPHAVYDSPEFAALEPIHVALLLLLLRKHNGFNNGDIPLGTREVEKRCHCGHATACRALKRLETDGLITATYKGHLVPEIGRPNVATRWRLTFLEEGYRGPPQNHRGGSPADHHPPMLFAPPADHHPAVRYRSSI